MADPCVLGQRTPYFFSNLKKRKKLSKFAFKNFFGNILRFTKSCKNSVVIIGKSSGAQDCGTMGAAVALNNGCSGYLWVLASCASLGAITGDGCGLGDGDLQNLSINETVSSWTVWRLNLKVKWYDHLAPRSWGSKVRRRAARYCQATSGCALTGLSRVMQTGQTVTLPFRWWWEFFSLVVVCLPRSLL